MQKKNHKTKPSNELKELLQKALCSRIYHSTGNAGLSTKANGFIERSILGAIGFIQGTVSNDEIAGKCGFLQSRDPRFKSLSIAILLCCVLASKSTIALSGFYITAIILALVSSINIGFFLKRTLFFIPLFSFFIVVPAIFSNITPGESVFSITVFSNHVSITRQGLGSALIFFMRVLASVSFAIILVLTTRHHVLLKVLRIFKAPQVFVMTMGMCYRYIFLFLDIIQKTFLAIKSRVGFVSSTKAGQKIAAMNMAGLWLKSYRLQTQVYDAMLSRGYAGEPKVIEEFKAGTVRHCFINILLIIIRGNAMAEPIFSLTDVSYSYPGNIPALCGLDLSINANERVAIIGANGTGKSTLLTMLDALIFPDKGSVRFLGQALTQHAMDGAGTQRAFRSKVGFVFQNPDIQLFCPTVKEDILFGPLQLGVPKNEIIRRLETVVERMRLKDLLERSPHQLSTGEKKKAAIASVLVIEPDVLLFDEPTAGLDPQTTRDIIGVIDEAHKTGKTVVMATHDLHLVEEIADVVHVFGSERNIIRSGRPDEILADNKFLRLHNLIHVHVHRHLHTSHSHPH